jgi:hypothetical protein
MNFTYYYAVATTLTRLVKSLLLRQTATKKPHSFHAIGLFIKEKSMKNGIVIYNQLTGFEYSPPNAFELWLLVII